MKDISCLISIWFICNPFEWVLHIDLQYLFERVTFPWIQSVEKRMTRDGYRIFATADIFLDSLTWDWEDVRKKCYALTSFSTSQDSSSFSMISKCSSLPFLEFRVHPSLQSCLLVWSKKESKAEDQIRRESTPTPHEEKPKKKKVMRGKKRRDRQGSRKDARKRQTYFIPEAFLFSDSCFLPYVHFLCKE